MGVKAGFADEVVAFVVAKAPVFTVLVGECAKTAQAVIVVA